MAGGIAPMLQGGKHPPPLKTPLRTRLVTLSTYRRYTNNCIYLSIYLSIYLTRLRLYCSLHLPIYKRLRWGLTELLDHQIECLHTQVQPCIFTTYFPALEHGMMSSA